MPGRLLTMERNGAESAKLVVNGNGKQSPAGAVQAAIVRSDGGVTAAQKQSESHGLTNGDSVIPGLGAYPTPTNGVSPTTPLPSNMVESMQELPEEIIHITENFHPLGTLIARQTQQCFSSLNDTINELAKIQIQPQSNGIANGVPALGGDTSRENKKKKKLMLEFASDFRAKFVKLLVVSNWSKDATQASRLIDLHNWENAQLHAAFDAAEMLGRTLADFRSFKIPNADLETALAVLSKADVPWIPHVRCLDNTCRFV